MIIAVSEHTHTHSYKNWHPFMGQGKHLFDVDFDKCILVYIECIKRVWKKKASQWAHILNKII